MNTTGIELIPFDKTKINNEAIALNELMTKREAGNARLLRLRNLGATAARYSFIDQARISYDKAQQMHLAGSLRAYVVKDSDNKTIGVATAMPLQPIRLNAPVTVGLARGPLRTELHSLDTNVSAWVDRYQFNSTELLAAAYKAVVQIETSYSHPEGVWTTEPIESSDSIHQSITESGLALVGASARYTDSETSRRVIPPHSNLYVYERPGPDIPLHAA